ncbi:MAG: trehalose-phosphatase [Beijerinckiaceae bacterium]|nr:trehalose-phosphatase [Beijerinckiaceae bacterium]
MATAPALLQPGELARIAPSRASAYFLDVDGTLLDIMPRPEDVSADSELREFLAMLARETNGALALISGRAIDGIDQIFAPLVLPAAGLHGAEIRFPDGSRRCAPGGVMDHVRPLVTLFVASRPGLRLEDKGAALALHFRQAPDLAREVLDFLQPLAWARGLAVQQGKMVAELKEAAHDKGKAIAAFMTIPPFTGRRPVFIGDDLTDESGFTYVNSQGGISVRTGPAATATQARYGLCNPSEVRAELQRLLTAC